MCTTRILLIEAPVRQTVHQRTMQRAMHNDLIASTSIGPSKAQTSASSNHRQFTGGKEYSSAIISTAVVPQARQLGTPSSLYSIQSGATGAQRGAGVVVQEEDGAVVVEGGEAGRCRVVRDLRLLRGLVQGNAAAQVLLAQDCWHCECAAEAGGGRRCRAEQRG